MAGGVNVRRRASLLLPRPARAGQARRCVQREGTSAAASPLAVSVSTRILFAHRDPQTEIFAELVAMSLCLDSDLRPFEDGVADFLGGP